jgi:macrolide transport system ATP-binding/permease protein
MPSNRYIKVLLWAIRNLFGIARRGIQPKGAVWMLLFLVRNIGVNLGGRQIISQIEFELNKGEKAALVGANGVGKTTLLEILAGENLPTTGQLKYFSSGSRYLLRQRLDFPPGISIRQYLLEGWAEERQAGKVDEALRRFSFEQYANRPVDTLSGGEKTRLALARAWISAAELLLLDEPTNHLDTEHLDWLEQFVNEYSGTVLIVSHDRYFLDRTISRVLELQSGGITSYVGNYSSYRQAKQRQFELDKKTYIDQEKAAVKLERAINAQQQWSETAHRQSTKKARINSVRKEFYRSKAKKLDKRAKNTIKRLERLKEERIARPKEHVPIDLSFTSLKHGSNRIILGDGIRKSYGDRVIFTDCRISMRPGEKVALVGPNGSGKTTLIRIILGKETMDRGELWLSPSLSCGYLQQEINELKEDNSLLDEVGLVCSDMVRVRNLLAELLFKGDAVFKPCSVLSMGERVRVALAKLLLGSYDLLVLDEPTNYLDLPSRERLEEALQSFSGSILLVCHDRYLLEKVCGVVWSIEENKVQIYQGRYSEYQELCKQRSNHRLGEEERLRLELRKAFLSSQLATIDREKDSELYQKTEQEYLELVKCIKKANNR